MGKAQREKGKRGEREVARIIRERTNLDAKRGVQYRGGPDSPDVVGLPGYHIEVKNVEKLNLKSAFGQSKSDAADSETPIVVHHRSREPWYVTIQLDDFLDLYCEAHGE